MPTK
ncbi:hypothetical protein CP061683_1158A, partial [Chlamydia psittaci 06-1683]|jgi:hypothetical protein